MKIINKNLILLFIFVGSLLIGASSFSFRNETPEETQVRLQRVRIQRARLSALEMGRRWKAKMQLIQKRRERDLHRHFIKMASAMAQISEEQETNPSEPPLYKDLRDNVFDSLKIMIEMQRVYIPSRLEKLQSVFKLIRSIGDSIAQGGDT